jgi:hypothetical protein
MVEEFVCECGRSDCGEVVPLQLSAYDALFAAGFPILAPGHRVSEGARSARLREDARALRNQAQLQVERAKRNLR